MLTPAVINLIFETKTDELLEYCKKFKIKTSGLNTFDDERSKIAKERKFHREVVLLLINSPVFVKFVFDCLKNANVNIAKYLFKTELRANQNFKLYDYQVACLEFMHMKENEAPNQGIRGGLLHLQMGLGKTLSALYYVFLTANLYKFPTLIVVPNNLLPSWVNQIKEYFPERLSSRVFVLYRTANKAAEYFQFNQLSEYDIILTTYSTCSTTCTKFNFLNDQGVNINPKTGRLKSGLSKPTYPNRPVLVKYYDRNKNEMDTPYAETQTGGKTTAFVESRIVKMNIDKFKADTSLFGHSIIYGVPWCRVICDESQVFAVKTTAVYKAMMAIAGKYFWCLTGTPIKNKASDLLSQLQFLGYEGTSLTDSDYRKSTIRNNIITFKYVDPIVENQIKLPYKQILIIKNDFKSPVEKYLYRKMFLLMQKVSIKFEQNSSKGGVTTISQSNRAELDRIGTGTVNNVGPINFLLIIIVFLRLRQICLCPVSIFNEEDSEINKIFYKRRSILGSYSTKSHELTKLVKKILVEKPGEKIIIFSMFSRVLEIIKLTLEEDPNIKSTVGMMVGTIPIKKRNEIIDDFNKIESNRILLLNYKIGAEGLTLTRANHCILLEPWWADYLHRQAYARIWRISQKRECFVYFLFIENTIEDYIIQLNAIKNDLTNKYFENAVENETTEKKTATALDFNKLKDFIKTQLKQFSELDIKVSDEEKRICDDIDRYINKYYDELVSGRRNKKELEAIAQEAEEEDEKVDEED